MIGTKIQTGETADLGTGQLVSVADVVRKIYTLVDGEGQPRIGLLPSRPGEETVQMAKATETKQLLNWQARLSLADGLKLMLEEQ